MSSVEEDGSITDGCVERCVEDEEGPVVALRQRTPITRWDNFYDLPGEGKAISKDAKDGSGTRLSQARGPSGQNREYWNQHIEEGEVSRFHAQTIIFQFLGIVVSRTSPAIAFVGELAAS